MLLKTLFGLYITGLPLTWQMMAAVAPQGHVGNVGYVGFHHASDNDYLLGADNCRYRLRHSLASYQREETAGGFCS